MRLGKDVDPLALRRFREARGLTHEQLADVVGASPLEVAAWEDGSVRVPREQARRLRGQDAADRREAALAAAVLPGCTWADAHAPDLHAMLLDQPGYLDPLSTAARVHLDDCAACARVRAFGCELLRLKPDPGLGTSVWDALEYWFDTAPRWVVYTLVLGGGTALTLGGRHLWHHVLRPEGDVWDVYGAVLLGAVAFAATATVLRRLLRRWPYLSGMVSGVAAVLTGMLVWVVTEPGAHWFSGPALPVLLLMAFVLGVLAGRWNEQNPWGDDAAEAGPVELGPERLAPPDPLHDVAAVPPAAAEPAPRFAPPA